MVVTIDFLRFGPGATQWEFARAHRHAPRRQAVLSQPFNVADLSAHPFPSPSASTFTSFGLLSVWPDADAAEAFATRAPLARRWAERAQESWRLVLRPLASHGTYMGRDPLPGLEKAPRHDGPVVIFTHGAAAGPRGYARFFQNNPAAVRHLQAQDGVVWTTGVQARPHHLSTVSLWRSLKAVTRFAYGPGDHAPQIKRMREERWTSENWFARFAPLSSSGTWGGSNPLDTL